MTPLDLRVELQALPVLTDVLSALSSLGGQVVRIDAAGNRAHLGIDIPAHLAHRVTGRLSQLIGVLSITAQEES